MAIINNSSLATDFSVIFPPAKQKCKFICPFLYPWSLKIYYFFIIILLPVFKGGECKGRRILERVTILPSVELNYSRERRKHVATLKLSSLDIAELPLFPPAAECPAFLPAFDFNLTVFSPIAHNNTQ